MRIGLQGLPEGLCSLWYSGHGDGSLGTPWRSMTRVTSRHTGGSSGTPWGEPLLQISKWWIWQKRMQVHTTVTKKVEKIKLPELTKKVDCERKPDLAEAAASGEKKRRISTDSTETKEWLLSSSFPRVYPIDSCDSWAPWQMYDDRHIGCKNFGF